MDIIIAIILSVIAALCFGLIRGIDENGHDSWDRMLGDTEGTRDVLGSKYHDDGSYDFWGNVFDTNPWSINNWDLDDY